MALVKAIGVDIIKVPRITRILESPRRDRFLRRVLHESEVARFQKIDSLSKASEYVAGSWAAKEAVFKTLDQSDQKQFQFNQWYRYNEEGKPQIGGDGTNPRTKFLLSISHDGGDLIAMVLRMDIELKE